jgi:hypothetical protein
MAIVAGTFTPSNLAASILRADKMWGDDMMAADFKANTEVVTALRAEQNAKVEILQDTAKDRQVKVYWANLCGEAAEDCDGDDCDLGGSELGSDSKVRTVEIFGGRNEIPHKRT